MLTNNLLTIAVGSNIEKPVRVGNFALDSASIR